MNTNGILLNLLFGVCAGSLVMGALLAVTTGRIIRGVCGLALCCLGLAGLYYFLNSPFLALMEILIYIGAVCVTIIFAVMLAEPEEPKVTEKPARSLTWGLLTVLMSALILAGVVSVGTGLKFPENVARVNDGSVHQIGISLLTTYSLAFEMISLVLLVGIIGALAIARHGRTKE